MTTQAPQKEDVWLEVRCNWPRKDGTGPCKKLLGFVLEGSAAKFKCERCHEVSVYGHPSRRC